MDISPLLNAPLETQMHVVCAVLSLVLTPVILLRRKGDRVHKLLGRFWVLVMALTALSSFAIHDIRLIGLFSPIHLLSLLTLYSLAGAIYQARAGRIQAHKSHMIGAMGGLLGAGLFTLIPGRLMSQVFFQGIELQGFIGSLVLAGLAIIVWRNRARGAETGALS
ncbi:DUF2306 domain-containing protein [Planktotalea sp.]|uniref:DUF2306 domain-containing protein n=1 Tax=Planktotalea sp. TaxID=2029877 RepID=UPI003D6A1362